MVTIESLTKTGKYSWKLVYSSDLPEPVFYIYLDGNLIAETERTEYTIAVKMDEGAVIEVLDDANAQPMQIFPGKVRLGWFFVEGTDYYRIDEYVGSEWIERKRMPENDGFLSWMSRFLEDGQTHQFRIVPVGTNGNEGTARQFAVLMCRRPDVPDVGFSYNEGAGKVIVYDNDNPPNDLINHCIAHYKMNDNAPNTTVIDSMKNSDGTAQQNTEDLHEAGKISGALSFNGYDDYISIPTTLLPKNNSPRSITLWANVSPIDADCLICWGGLGTNTIFGLSYYDYAKMGIPITNLIGEGTAHLDTDVDWITGQWVFWAITYDGDKIRLYANGVLVWTSNSIVLNTGDTKAKIGMCYTDLQYPANGLIDDVQIFDKALSQADISFLYNNGNGREDF